MKRVLIQITQVRARYFKLFNRVQSTQDEKARFIKGNELKLRYFHSFFFKRVRCYFLTIEISKKKKMPKNNITVKPC